MALQPKRMAKIGDAAVPLNSTIYDNGVEPRLKFPQYAYQHKPISFQGLLLPEWVNAAREAAASRRLAHEFCVLRGLEIWHDGRMHTHRHLWDTYRFPDFRPSPTIRGIFGAPKARVVRLQRRGKKRHAASVDTSIAPGTTGGYAEYATCPAGTHGSIWSWRFAASLASVAAR